MSYFFYALTCETFSANAGAILGGALAPIGAVQKALEGAVEAESAVGTRLAAEASRPACGAVAGAVDRVAIGAVLAQTFGAAAGAERAGVARL